MAQLQGIFSEGYGLIPKKMMKDSGLSAYEKLVMAYLLSYTGGGSFAWPSQRLIADDLGVSTKTVNRALSGLERAKFIKSGRLDPKNAFNKSKIYEVLDLSCDGTQGKHRRDSGKTPMGLRENPHGTQGKPLIKKTYINNNNENNNNSPSGDSPKWPDKLIKDFMAPLWEHRKKHQTLPLTASKKQSLFFAEKTNLIAALDRYGSEKIDALMSWAMGKDYWSEAFKSYGQLPEINRQYQIEMGKHEDRKPA